MPADSDPGDNMEVDNETPTSTAHHAAPAAASSPEESESDELPADLMVVSRARRSNAGNRMSTLLAQAAEEEEWGEEWEEAPNEEDFVEEAANDQDDYNLESSSSSEDEDEGADDEAGEKELRRAERQERNRKRKAVPNPFAARLAAAVRKKVRVDVPHTEVQPVHVPRPKKKSERASWIPMPEDGPTRTSSRKLTVANKEHTLAKLKEKDRRRDDTLAMMKAAEARKAKSEHAELTQAERLAEAARTERMNKKSLHRWEEAEEQRAAERKAKLEALKNRQIEGPYIRFWSGPAIWVDDKIKYTGKDAPKVEELREKLNKEIPSPSKSKMEKQDGGDQPSGPAHEPPHDQIESQSPRIQGEPVQSQQQTSQNHAEEPQSHAVQVQQPQQTTGPDVQIQEPNHTSRDHAFPDTLMFPPPQTTHSFLSGIEQYATDHPSVPQDPHQPSEPISSQNNLQWSSPPAANATQNPVFDPNDQSSIPPNPFSQPYHPSPFSQPHFPPTTTDPALAHNPPDSRFLLQQFQRPPPPAQFQPPAPPRKKQIQKALRNLLILSSFPSLDDLPPSSTAATAISSTARVRTASALRDRDRSALIQISRSLFGWSLQDATAFVNAMLSAPRLSKAKAEKAAAAADNAERCVITNKPAKYRDPRTALPYRDRKAFQVLRGVVSGDFVWCGGLGCFVGGRGRGGQGVMTPARGVPARFLDGGMKGMAATGRQGAGNVAPVNPAATPAANTSAAPDGVGTHSVAAVPGGTSAQQQNASMMSTPVSQVKLEGQPGQ
ncbi:YL1-domain-containing protein [Westerdykella ornata]|uniref:YL1-domain-containing protein n=1 Tax=Westerdykella ornata TaxID=318751 RepID=A0A6A6JPX2_WESOR|nr:YL1-domain-containing protein [Westerdykella ornata]KAF2277009.1 YL1-domain-containing protein [Westerdykella ornata]